MEWFAEGGLLVIQCSPQWLAPLSWFWWCTFEKGIALLCKHRETIGKWKQRRGLGSDGWCWFFCIGPWPAPLGQQEALLWVRCFLQHCQSRKIFQKNGNGHPSLHKGDPCTGIGTSLHFKSLVQCHPRANNEICEGWCAAYLLCAWGSRLLGSVLHYMCWFNPENKKKPGAVSSGVGSLAKGIQRSGQPNQVEQSQAHNVYRPQEPSHLSLSIKGSEAKHILGGLQIIAARWCLAREVHAACWTAWNTCKKWWTCMVMQTLCPPLPEWEKIPLGKSFWTSIPCWLHGLKRKRDFSSTRRANTMDFSTWLKTLDGWTPDPIGASPMKILWAKSACSLIASLLEWVPPGCQWK